MTERSPRRIAAEELIASELKTAQSHAIVPFLLYKAIGVLDHEKATQLYKEKMKDYKLRYHQVNIALRQIEQEEGYRNIQRYIDMLLDVRSRIPESLHRIAYYPYAGLDVFWLAGFQNLIMEDKNYNSPDDNPTAWWDADDYKIESLQNLVARLKTNGLISQNNSAKFSIKDSLTSAALNEVNQPFISIIYKAGPSFVYFLEKAFKNREMAFGAIIVANDNTRPRVLDRVLNKHNYHKVYELNPEMVVNPWSLPISRPKVYLKV